MPIPKLPLWLVLVFGSSWAVSQPLASSYARFTTEQGLADNWVHTALQDSQGFLWFGCEGGLSRFDGQHFLNFFKDKNRPNSLANNTVRGICEDADGVLWLAVLNGGLHRFDPATGKFDAWETDPENLQFKGELTAIVQDGDLLWLGSYNHGLGCFDKKKQQYIAWHSYPTDEHSTDTYQFNTVNHLIADRQNPRYLWVAAANRGLARFDKQTHRFEVWPISGVSGKTGVSAMRLVQDEAGLIWIGTWSGGIASFDPRSAKMEIYPYDLTSYHQPNNYNRNVVQSLLLKDEHELWVGTEDNGFGTFDRKTGKFNFFKNEFSGESPELDRMCQGLYVDLQKRLWVLGRQGGVRVFAPQQTTFRYVSLAAAAGGGRSERAEVADIAYSPSRRSLFVATENNGCFEWSDERNTLVQRATPLPDGTFPFFKTLLCDTKGNTWAGTAKTLGGGASLYVLRPGKLHFEAAILKFQPARGLEETVNDLLEDTAGNIWVATSYDGFYKLNPNNFAVESFRDQPSFAKDAPAFNKWWALLDMSLAPNGHIWFALKSGGVVDFDPTTRKFKLYNSQNGLASNEALAVECSSDGRIWVATKNGGVQSYRPGGKKGDVLELSDKMNGQHGQLVSAIGLDSVAGLLWLNTDKGLASMDPENDKMTIYGRSSGLRNAYLMGKGLAVVKGVGVVVGQPNGFCWLKQEGAVAIPPTPDTPRVVLTDLKIFNQSKYFEKQLRTTKELVLNPTESVFSFEFAMPTSLDAELAVFQYQLEGLDGEWYVAEDKHSISYSGLQPGTYTLKVRGVLPGNVTSAETRLRIRIMPNWWQTWWARSVAILAFGAALFFIYRLRTRQLKREHELQRQMIELERSALQAQMNPHFIFNCLGAIQNFILQNESEQAIEYLGSFAQLVRGVLNASVTGKVTLKEELSLLEGYLLLEQLRFNHRFEYEVKVAEGMSDTEITIPPLLIQPYIENAVLHGMTGKKNGGKVEVCFQPQGEYLNVVVRDNGHAGMGTGQPKTHKSVGMSITRRRLELLGSGGNVEVKTLKDKEGNIIGTEVTIAIGFAQEKSDTIAPLPN
ncbi:MAG: histidine kinase [Saprospiraceae bacterium]|nr:histidine kinase [Saprospiraceae bacterium]